MTKDQVLGALPLLSYEDLATVRAACDHLMGHRAAENEQATPLAALLFDALAGALRARVSYQAFRQSRTYPHWQKNWPTVTAFVDTHFARVKRSKVLHTALLCYFVSLLRDDLNNRDVPITLGSLVTNLARLPQVFEKAFPGYLDSELTDLIIKQMEKGNGANRADVGKVLGSKTKRAGGA